MSPELAHLFTRPFWLDEWHTALVANRGSLAEVLSDLYRGSDMGPPVLHLIAWSVARLTGGEVTPAAARLTSFAAVLAALAFVFLILRRRLGAAASVAGVLAVASSQLVITHAFELRYYCLWLAFAAGFAWALGMDDTRARSRRRDATVAILAILLCLTHWLAAASLGLICLGALASFGRDWRAGLRRVLPGAAGLVAVALSIPLVLAQRAAVPVKSWMPDVTLGEIGATLSYFWGATVVVLAVLVILITSLTPARESLRSSIAGILRDPSCAALLSLFTQPLAMAVLSIGYPAMHPRYLIVTFLSWAPIVAIAVQPLGRATRGLPALVALRTARGFVFLVLLLFMWASSLNAAVEASGLTSLIASAKKSLAQACGMKLPVVFEVRHLMYPATDGLSRRWAACDTRYLAISDATIGRMFPPGNNQSRLFLFENEIARLHEQIYGRPKVWTQAQLDSVPRFLLLAWDNSLPMGFKNADRFGLAVFPNHRVTRLTEDIVLFERR